MQNKNEILSALTERFEKIGQILSDTDAAGLTTSRDGKWSAAEIIQHLVLTNASVASIFKLDKQNWIDRFGAPGRPSRTFDQMSQAFQHAFSTPVKAPPRYVPALTAEDTPEMIKTNWNGVLNKFRTRVANWTEEDLDQCGVPHPALGLLTAREHLFFAVLHTDHHIRQIER